MILAIAIAAAVTLGLYTAVRVFHSRWMVSSICETTIQARRNPVTARRYTATQIYSINRAIGGIIPLGIGVMAGLAAFGIRAILVLASPARAEPAPCMSAALQMAFTRVPGIQVQRITREGTNPAAVVEAFLANAGAPDLNTDDFILATDAEKVVVTPVRAGQVCRNFTRLAFPMASGGQALLKAIELAAMGAGRA